MSHDWSMCNSGLYLYDVRHLPFYDNALCSVRKKAVCLCICFSFDSILIKSVDKETVTYFTNGCEKSMMRQSVWCPLSLFLVMSSINSTSGTSWASNDKCFLNAFCFVKNVVWSAWCIMWLVNGDNTLHNFADQWYRSVIDGFKS